MPPKKEKTFQIPQYYLDEHDENNLPPGFQEAFNHARGYGNNDKASLLYAETHHLEWDPSATKEKE